MPNMTLSVPPDLHKEMRTHPEIKWAQVAREALRKEIDRLHVYDRLLAGSRLTEADAVRFGKEIRRRASRRNR